MTVSPEYYRDLLARRFAGRKVIIAYGQLNNMAHDVGLMRELGADDVFVLCEGRGTGTTEIDFEYWVDDTPIPGGALMHHLRRFEKLMRALPDEVVARLDAFDPGREALVVRPLWGTFLEVAGRPVYNPRPPSWVALEDKVVIDELWQRLGVPHAEHRIVDVDRAALDRAHAELDRGAGTVWAGDAREGWHGGSEMTHWVIDTDSAARAHAALAGQCDRARVMPFLEGIPCSIHSMVSPGGEIATLRPVEMNTLRDRERARLRYFGTSTLWDPAVADREDMRRISRRVGEALRDELGFRGTFTIDGVMTADGFRPTELNPRYGAGMFRLAAGCENLPLWFVDCAMVYGETWDFRMAELEQMVVEGADANRMPMVNAWDARPRDTIETTELARDPAGGYRRAGEGDEVVGSVLSGPSPLGGFHRVNLVAAAHPTGASIGPIALEALAFLDRELGTGFGKLAAARQVR